MKIIFMGTPEFATTALEALYNNNYDLGLVVTQEDKPKGRGKKLQPTSVKIKALELGLEVYQPKSINSEESIFKLSSINADLIVTAAYGQILKKQILDLPSFGAINIHASLLPRWRGAAPIQRAILNEDKETGVTIMNMELGLDTGNIIMAKSIPLDKSYNTKALTEKLSQLGAEVLIQAIELKDEWNRLSLKQEDSLATYAKPISKDEALIDWNKSADLISAEVRAFNPWPISFSYLDGVKMKIHKATVINRHHNSEAGKILKADKNGILVSTGVGCLLIEELQFPGKNKMKVEDYIRGNKLNVSSILKGE